MAYSQVISLMLLTVFILALVGAGRRVRMWRRGTSASTELSGLLYAPKRFFVDVHHVVDRDKYMSNTHMATAGGFVASLSLIILVYLVGLNSKWLIWPLVATLIVMALGAIAVAARRIRPPKRLSTGPWNRLPFSLLSFSLGFLVLVLPATGLLPNAVWHGGMFLVLALCIAWGVCELIFGMSWGGPMKHAFAGFIHLAFHCRPERFTRGGISSDLKPLDLNADKLGVEKPSDFKWNQLLGFDACVQCGRCEAACPAFAAGQPLNPKKLIQDMVIGFTGGNDSSYHGSLYPGGRQSGESKGAHDKAVVPGLIDADTLWSCTTCRACVYECPMMIEHVDAIIDMRRFLTLEKGKTPSNGVKLLDDIIATDNPGGRDPSRRADWASDLNLPRMADKKQVDVLFWAGDAAFELRNQRTLRSVAQLMKLSGTDFAILGEEELDCGDAARRLGDEAAYQRLAKRNIARLNQYQFKRIVTADPHALQALSNEYRSFGGRYEVWHHTRFFDEQVKRGHLQPRKAIQQSVTYHDPCYLGRYNGEINAPRSLLKAIGIEIQEMERSGMRSRCCGGGGAAPITDIPGEQRIPDIRMEDARATQADVVAVACPQCTVMLEGVVQPRPEVKDIAELLLEAVEES